MTKVNKEFPGASILFHKRGELPGELQAVWASPRLLAAVEQLVGPDVAGHPVWNLRVKLPGNEAEVREKTNKSILYVFSCLAHACSLVNRSSALLAECWWGH